MGSILELELKMDGCGVLAFAGTSLLASLFSNCAILL